MCGIAGIVGQDARQHTSALRRMLQTLRHRGPDDSGIACFDGCVLGHTRLSIIDLSDGRQPMRSPVSGAAVTFNGEIYGYKSLRASLSGYPFRTASDTEVILALYDEVGPPFVSRLPGMFAFGLWNDTERTLLAVRDRFGEKPFYYARGPAGELIFASEIKAILASGLVDPIVSLDALAHYLQFQYVHPHQTIYTNVHVLPPAHTLTFSGGALRVAPYWDLPPENEAIELRDASAECERLLDRAVQQQLVADVPVAAFLSGGLDSSTIVALAVRHHRPLTTIAFGFDRAASELPYARAVAELNRTAHIELMDTDSDVAELAVQMQDVYDEPFGDSSNIPTFLISRLARQHAKVVLTGDGGDELLGGYDQWYRPLHNMARQRVDSPPLLLVARVLNRLARAVRLAWQIDVNGRLQGRAYRRRYASITQAHFHQQQRFAAEDVEQFGLTPHPVPDDGGRHTTVSDALIADVRRYLPGDILVKIDRASMAHGLELRAPFLDVDFATFCLTLPMRLKVTNETDKYLLRRTFEHTWPAAVRSRSKKGFSAPVGVWFTLPSVIELKQEFLNRPSARIFSLLPFEKTRADVARDDKRTWTLLMLSLWLERRGAVRGAAADDTWQAVASTPATPSDRGERPG